MLYERGLMAIPSSPLRQMFSIVPRHYEQTTYPSSVSKHVLWLYMEHQARSTLIYKIGQTNVVGVHCVETVRILHPILTVWSLGCRVVHINVIKPHVFSVHDVDRPQG